MTLRTPENIRNLIYPLLSIALIFIIAIGMQTAAYFINIMLISLLLTLLGVPILRTLKKRGLSDYLSVAIIMAIYIVGIAGFIFLIYESAYFFVARLPEYQDLLTLRLSDLMSLLGHFGVTEEVVQSVLTPDWNAISKMAVGI